MRLIRRPLWVWHHTKDTAVLGNHPRDIGDGPVGIVGIGERNTPLIPQLRKFLIGDEIIAIVMRNGNVNLLPKLIACGERRLRILNPKSNRLADIFEVGIAPQRTGQNARLGEDLKPVTDPSA